MGRRTGREGAALYVTGGRRTGAWLALLFCLGLFGCGRQGAEIKQESSVCREYDHAGYTSEGMIYQDYNAGLVKYLDYATGGFYPLCVRPNCLHDSDECAAKALCGEVMFMGRLGDKWYYFRQDETEETFHSCDLDGGNDRVVGTYPYEEKEEDGLWNDGRGNVWGNVVFRDGSCFLAMNTDNSKEDPNISGVFKSAGVTSNLYRYDLETGEREALCPEKTMEIPCYMLWGIYENQLIYSELLEDEPGKRVSGLHRLDLETGEDLEPGLTVWETLSPGCLSGSLLLYNEPGRGLMEFDLETGEKTAVFEGYGSNIIWEPELKTFTVSDFAGEDLKYRVYQYTEEGECRALYEDEAFIPSALAGDWVVGNGAEPPQFLFKKSVIKKEDFLAGKTNWTVIVSEEKQ